MRLRNTILARFQSALAALPSKYDVLDEVIRRDLNVGQVYLTEYPDPTIDTSGATCPSILGDASHPPHGGHNAI